MTFDFNKFGETIQIWGTSSGTDGLGNPTKTWDSDKGTVKGIPAKLKRNEADITTPAGRIAATDKKVIVPATATIATGDRLEIDSINYECMGEYADWVVRKRNTIDHLEILLRKVIT